MEDWMRKGIIIQGALVASAIIAFLSIVGFLVVPLAMPPLADMRIEPLRGAVKLGETFVVRIVVTARTPVNVFAGELHFDPEVLAVESIDYNLSIADLWAERPWYENGAGTMNFIGGTTVPGGFLGTGSLITVTFRSRGIGEASVRMDNVRILEHNGLGTDVELGDPIDSIFVIGDPITETITVAKPTPDQASFLVVPELPSTDLNGDGKQTISDVSIFMRGMFSDDPRLDFNRDGVVDAKDLSILMSAK